MVGLLERTVMDQISSMKRQENADETQSHEDSQKDQRSRPLALINSSKS